MFHRRPRRRAVQAILTAALAIATVAVSATPAVAAPIPSGNSYGYRIRLYDTNLCLDAALETLGRGGKVQLWICSGGTNQMWYHSNSSWYNARNPYLCLDAAAEVFGNGGRVQLWDCYQQPNQRWTDSIGADLRSWVLHSKKNYNYCLDARAETIGNGGAVQIWSCSSNANQRWYYEPV
jgi:hypothetical protein